MPLDINIDTQYITNMLSRIANPEIAKLSAIMIRTELHSRIAPYPPSSEANRPFPGKTHYKRSYGSVYTKKSGGSTLYRTSQMAGRKWKTAELTRGAILRNVASYSVYLHDKKRQPGFHKMRGWKTYQNELNDMRDNKVIERIIQSVIRNNMR